MATEGYIRLPEDGIGKKTRTRFFTIGSNVVHHTITELADFATRLETDSEDANVSYAGKALAGSATSSAVWQIKKIDETSGIVLTWAGGNNDFVHQWDDRETLIYL